MPNSDKQHKLIHAAAAVLRYAPNSELNIVVLNKALFYVDLVALRDQGETLTGNAYIALQNGPVIAKYPQRLIKALQSEGIAQQQDRWDGAKPVLLTNPQEPAQFLLPHLDSIERVAAYFASMSSEAASEYSHLNPGWTLAWDLSRETGKPAPINMMIALQQIVEDDPWLSEPLTQHERSLIVPAADNGEGELW